MKTQAARLTGGSKQSTGTGVSSMHQGQAAILESIDGSKVALKGVNIEAELRDLLAEVSVTQTYTNEEPCNIEAVYTFPLPVHATLLDLAVTMGGRVLKGTIVEKRVAEDSYEDAIVDGDTAIMLQQPAPGLYTMNVGNLQPGETAVIRIQYALFQQWDGDRLRFMIPTVIAPRYGDPERGGFQPHQVTSSDPLVEYTYSLCVRVKGLLESSKIESPSHEVSVAKTDEGTVIQLARGGATLDRDFILNFHVANVQPAAARADRDIDGYVALASFRPELGDESDARARSVKIVVDCSGSMGGDSIAQARLALLNILGLLRPQDNFNIVKFGSHHVAMFPGQVPASHANLQQAMQAVRELDADMGGTEIGHALQAAYELGGDVGIRPDLLLITDGEIWNADQVIDEARASGHRIFTVGVGSAVAEAFVRNLAEECGGVCELVSPNEEMALRIQRQFVRIYSPLAREVDITWPPGLVARFPKVLGPVYQGDTVHMLAWFSEPPAGDVSMSVTLSNGRRSVQTAAILCEPGATDAGKVPHALPGTLARIAAARKLAHLDEPRATALALRYQLISAYTHYLVVDEREIGEKAEEMPGLRKVPQMLAAGWGGTGTVENFKVSSGPVPSLCLEYSEDLDLPPIQTTLNRRVHKTAWPCRKPGKGEDYLDIPAFLRRQADLDLDLPSPPGRQDKRTSTATPAMLVDVLNQCSPDWFIPSLRIRTLVMLRDLGLSSDVLAVLNGLVTSGVDEELVVIVFLYLLTESKVSKDLKREARRAIARAYKDTNPGKSISDELQRVLSKTPTWDILGV